MRAQPQALDRQAGAVRAGQHDHRHGDLVVVRGQAGQHLGAAQIRQLIVEQDAVRPQLLRQVQPFAAGVRFAEAELGVRLQCQLAPAGHAIDLMVLDDQQMDGRSAHSGSSLRVQ